MTTTRTLWRAVYSASRKAKAAPVQRWDIVCRLVGVPVDKQPPLGSIAYVLQRALDRAMIPARPMRSELRRVALNEWRHPDPLYWQRLRERGPAKGWPNRRNGVRDLRARLEARGLIVKDAGGWVARVKL